MVRVEHISAELVGEMVGDSLFNELWMTGMMNELRRHPNSIPCSDGEIPSMLIPKCSGSEKVEWGFTAGMSCLIPKAPGRIEIRHADMFPSSAVLALLSCWYHAGALEGKKLTTTLLIPDNAKAFISLLNKVEPKLTSVSIKRESIPTESLQEQKMRKALGLSNSIAVCTGVQGVDIGRFQFTAKCINGTFQVGDEVTITDGDFIVRAEHCPILSLSNADNTVEFSSTDDADDDMFGAYIAVWFPENTAFNGINIVKEVPQPSFIPEKMPDRIEIAEPVVKAKGGFLHRLFGKP